MTSGVAPENARALFSRDGRTWADGGDVREWTPDATVTKIVLGSLEGSDEQADAAGSADDTQGRTDREPTTLPPNLATRYPNLTHLYLWGLDLEVLPELPVGLKCLDARNSRRLRMVPTLPDTLETLDLGTCGALVELPSAPASLTRFFFNGCASLKRRTLENFLADLTRHGAKVVEIDGSECPSVSTLDEFPRTLRRLVLAGCPSLTSVEGLATFAQLQHLNLRGCTSLKSLPALPSSLQYLELREADALTRFLGQDIGPYDRGTEERPNVAGTLRSRMKFGSELATSAHAKLLLLGDGRAGKSTLAKRLQWDGLSRQQQADPAFAWLRPQLDEPFTHKVRFSRWATSLQIDEKSALELNARASAAGLTPPCDSTGATRGSIRIWDFGGQEIYHQTHRIFAAEGSVFVIVWNTKVLADKELLAQKPSNVSDDEWLAWNQRRTLDYWLEYVRSIRQDARIVLVCTNCRRGAPRVPWTELAPRHADAPLECYYIDSLEEPSTDNPDYRKLVRAIRTHCGAEAARIGILQPAFYEGVASYVDSMLEDNDRQRQEDERPTHLLIPGAVWGERLRERHAAVGQSALELEASDVEAITGYLHDAGHVFRLRDRGADAVLVDQDWATSLIYAMLHPGGAISNVIRKKGGWFEPVVLELDAHWQQLALPTERQLILDYMEKCGIVVPLVDQHQHREGKQVFLATERWLLPPYRELEHRLEGQLNRVVKQSTFGSMEEFVFGEQPISTFDFRALLAHVGRVLGSRGTYFREGLQACDAPDVSSWCFQMRWAPRSENDDRGSNNEPFWGTVDARLFARREYLDALAGQVTEVLAGEGSPLSASRRSLRRVRSASAVPVQCYFRAERDSDFAVAVSSSGKDAHIVRQLVESLEANDLPPKWYRLENCRADDLQKVMPFMASLRRPPCLLLYLSDAYLADDADDNWYCVWELADAIVEMAEGRRSVEQTIVVYADGGTLNSKNVNEIALRVLRNMGKAFDQKFDSIPDADQSAFEHYRDWAQKFRKARKAMPRFYDERGTLGAYTTIGRNLDGSYDFSHVIADVRKGLDRSRRTN